MNKTMVIIIAAVLLVLLAAGYVLTQNQSTEISTTPESTTGIVAETSGEVTNTTVDSTLTPGKPVPTTNATVAPADTTAVVTGTVIPKGAITTYWYEYGTTKDLGKKTAPQVVGSGYTAIATPGFITGLTKNTTYYFKLVAQNELGTVAGEQNSVTTTSFSSAPVGSIPTITTVAANGITASAATLKGSVNPNKVATQYWFEIGKNGTLGGVTTFTSVGDGSAVVPASATVSNLEAGTTYYYRINAQNQYGTVNGAILTFKTGGKVSGAAPVVTTQVPSSVTASSATAVGTVNPYGAETKFWFEYSTNSNLSQSKSSQKKSAGAGASTVSVEAPLYALKAHTTFYVRIVAENAAGTTRGETQTFQTK